jgi:hypothetical protein
VCAALDQSVPRVHGDAARALLGDGTGVIVGIVDSGMDATHPALTGTDSLGNPRLVAQANFVTSEPSNTGGDVYGHGTAVGGVALGRDPVYNGIATDARYVNARVLDSGNGFAGDPQVINGIGFALQNNATVLNLSLTYFATGSSGGSRLALMTDWAAYSRGVTVVGITGNDFGATTSPSPVQALGDAYNLISTAATGAPNAYDRVAAFSRVGPVGGNRSKPDIAAPGQSITTANANWETGADFNTWDGTSFAAPHVTGIVAAATEYGRAHGLSTSPIVFKAALMNSAEKVKDRDGNAWAPLAASTSGGLYTATGPLDNQSGAGQVDGLAFARQYAAGRFAPGAVSPVGWALDTITGTAAPVDYAVALPLQVGSTFAATLAWNRHVGRTDDGNGLVDNGDTFSLLESLDNLDLYLLRDGTPVAASVSTVDNVEHLYFTVTDPGLYTVRVARLDVAGSGTSEEFALAWAGTAVPEPGAVGAVMTLAAGGALLGRRGRPGAAARV